jgi:hypothetical protein
MRNAEQFRLLTKYFVEYRYEDDEAEPKVVLVHRQPIIEVDEMDRVGL